MDKYSQAGSVGLGEQELASVSGGQFTPEELQHIEQITGTVAKNESKVDYRPLVPSAIVGVGAGFATHAAGETLHKKLTSHH
jgi:hypothetical protein